MVGSIIHCVIVLFHNALATAHKSLTETHKRNIKEMLSKFKIIISDIEFEKGKTVINHEPNKMWDTDVITTSSRIHWKRDGISYSSFVKADNRDDAILEIIPKLQIQEFFEHSFSFVELGIDEPFFESEDGETGTIEFVDSFLHERRNLHVPNEDDVMGSLYDVASLLFPVVIF